MNLPEIPSIHPDFIEAARLRQHTLTKPPGSLGKLEELSINLAGMTGRINPAFEHKTVIIMAGDHGITAEGVSAYPSEVTRQMVLNFLHGGAAINVLARQAGAEVIVVDIGVASDIPPMEGLIQRKVARGSRNFLKEPAMSAAQAEQAVGIGIEIAAQAVAGGMDLVATGDMGIGNTTSAAAITAVLTGLPVAQVTGCGTGIDEAGWQRKVQVIEQAIQLQQPDPHHPMEVLRKLGGFEIAGLAGVIIGAAAQGLPVVIDGFISGTAALIASRLIPEVKTYLIASHLSVEAGHLAILDDLGLAPLLNLNMRLGEGTGAALAFHLVEAACRILTEMATFKEAGVSGKK